MFIPSEDFFTNWLDDLNSYFGDTFGILYYPFELLIDFLNRISSISNSSTAVLNIPDVKINMFGNELVLIKSFKYDFYSILTTDVYKNIHTIYLTVVDIILWLFLVSLASKCLHSVIGGIEKDDLSGFASDEDVEGTVPAGYNPRKAF